MALKDTVAKIKRKITGEDEPLEPTFPKALKSDHKFSDELTGAGGTSRSYKVEGSGPEALNKLDITESLKHGNRYTADGRYIYPNGIIRGTPGDNEAGWEDAKDDTERQRMKDTGVYKPEEIEAEVRKQRRYRVMNNMKKGGTVKSKAKPKVSSASKRADGCATKGKTRGRII